MSESKKKRCGSVFLMSDELRVQQVWELAVCSFMLKHECESKFVTWNDVFRVETLNRGTCDFVSFRAWL